MVEGAKDMLTKESGVATGKEDLVDFNKLQRREFAVGAICNEQ